MSESSTTLQDIGNKTVGEIMVVNGVTVTPETCMRKVVLLFNENRFEGIPVIQDGRLAGMAMRTDLLNMYFTLTSEGTVQMRDTFRLTSILAPDHTVDHFMRTNVLTVVPEITVSRLSELMIRHDLYTFPVIRKPVSIFSSKLPEYLGIVTFSDLVPLLYDSVMSR